MSALSTPAARAVLDAIRQTGARNDAAAKQAFRAAREQRGERLAPAEAAALYRDAPLAVVPAVGELLHVLVLARRPRLVVEFGTSLGASAIHLAAGLRDAGAGRLVTTEIDAAKAAVAADHLAAAGLADLVEIRVGDARATLRSLAAPVDLLFLDGFGDSRLDVLRTVEPLLAAAALVVADQSAGDPYWDTYHAYVSDPQHGYATVGIPLDAGVELSVRR